MKQDRDNFKKPFKAGAKAVTTLAIGSMLAIGGLLVTVQPAKAATFNVNTFDDELNTDGDCSLREAVVAINTAATVDACPAGDLSGNTINLQAGTYNLTLAGTGEDSAATGDLDLLRGGTVINGAGRTATIISTDTGVDADNDRAFELHGIASNTIQNLTIQGAKTEVVDIGLGIYVDVGSELNVLNVVIKDTDGTTLGGGNVSTASFGGAIGNIGNVVVLNSLFENNMANFGAAIYNEGTIQVGESIIRNNTAQESGGGITSTNDGDINIVMTYFTNNASYNTQGGHLDIYGTNAGNATISNSTFNGGSIVTGGLTSIAFTTFYNSPIFYSNGTTRVGSSVFAGTVNPSCAEEITSTTATFTSEGYNISSTNCPGLTASTDRNNTDPQLNSTLTAVGNTFVFTPSGSNSPVVDAADPALTIVNVDQTSYARPFDGNGDGTARSDIGAYEYRGVISTPTATTSPTAAPTSTPTVTPTPKKLPDTGFNILLPTVGGMILGFSTLSTTIVESYKKRSKKN